MTRSTFEGASRASSDPPPVTTPPEGAGAGADEPKELSAECHEQIRQAMADQNLHIGRMRKHVPFHMAEDMWSDIMNSVLTRMQNMGPVDDITTYVSKCVSNRLKNLQITVEVLIGDQDKLAALRAEHSETVEQVLLVNHRLVETINELRGVLNGREIKMLVLRHVFGEDNKFIARYFDPPTTEQTVATTLHRVTNKLNVAVENGRLEHLRPENQSRRRWFRRGS